MTPKPEILSVPPVGLTPITDLYELPREREMLLAVVEDALRRGRRVAVVGDEKRAAVYCSGVQTCEQRNHEAVKTGVPGGLRPTAKGSRH